MNEESPQELSLNLTLTQHLHDENLKTWKVHLPLEVKPLQAWYYQFFPNFHTFVILLHFELTSDDEPETIYEGFYKIE